MSVDSFAPLLSTRRRFLIHTAAAATAALVLPKLLRGDDTPPPPSTKPNAPFMEPIRVETLAEGLFVVMNAGGNTLVQVVDDALLVIDSGVPYRAVELLAQVDKLAPNARRKTLFNTHWHFDHAGGNAKFADAGYQIIATAKTDERLGQRIVNEDMGMEFPLSPPRAHPTVTFTETLALRAPEPIMLRKSAPAHTDTDAIAIFESRPLIHTGDLHFNGFFPVIDRATGGSLDGMIAASKMLLELTDAKTQVIPGHGPIGSKNTVQSQLDLLNTIYDRLAPYGEKQAGMEEVIKAAPLEDLNAKWGGLGFPLAVATKMYYGQWIGH